jgi:DNA-binding response OmpR family regulator
MKSSLPLSRQVVVVHRDAAIRQGTAEQLLHQGYLPTLGTSAEDAYVLCGRLQPSMLLLETDLVGESGFLVCAKVKLQHPHCKVVLIDSAHGAGYLPYARFVGADAVVEAHAPVASLVTRI